MMLKTWNKCYGALLPLMKFKDTMVWYKVMATIFPSHLNDDTTK